MNSGSIAASHALTFNDIGWLQILFDDSPDAIFVSKPDGRLIQVNRAAIAMTGLTEEELIESDIRDNFFSNNPTEFDLTLQKISSGEFIIAEAEIRKKSGATADIEISCRKITFRDEDFICCTARDITRLRKAKAALRKLTFHSEQVREEERSRIALDLHDDLGQRMTALKMDVSWLKSKIDEESEMISVKLGGMANLIDDTVRTIQKISSDLRPGILYDLGLPAAIEWHLDKFSHNTGIESVANIVPEDFELDEKLSVAIFRIVQEALTNTARHSGADIVSVSIIKTGTRLKVTIRDNGSGIPPEAMYNPNSFGIFGMRERARLFGGELRVKGAKGKGTSISVEFNTNNVGNRQR